MESVFRLRKETSCFPESRETTEIDYKNRPRDTTAYSAASQRTLGQFDMRVVFVFLSFNQIYRGKDDDECTCP